jgi:hypothetical protein
MSTFAITAPVVQAQAYNEEFPTRNTEELARYILTLFKTMAEEGFVIDDGQISGDVEEFIFDSLWNAQSTLIKQQQERFGAVTLLLERKKSALPDEGVLSDLVEMFIDAGLTTFTNWILSKIALSSVGALAGGIIIPLTITAIQTLRDTYLDGAELLTGINSFMDSLIGGDLPKTKANYDMRSALIDQNERQLSNYLNEMVLVETSINGATAGADSEGLSAINETLARFFTEETFEDIENLSLQQAWEAQTSILNEQKTRIQRVKGLLQEKTNALPDESTITDIVGNVLQNGVETLTSWVVANVAATEVGGMLGGVTIPLLTAGIATLKGIYLDGDGIMDGILTGIESMISGLNQSTENFTLRDRAIQQNENRLASFISEMMEVERQIRDGKTQAVETLGGGSLSEINETLMLIAKGDATIICPHTGHAIYRKSLAAVSL